MNNRWRKQKNFDKSNLLLEELSKNSHFLRLSIFESTEISQILRSKNPKENDSKNFNNRNVKKGWIAFKKPDSFCRL